MTPAPETLVDVLQAFSAPAPDDRALRVAILKRERWEYDRATSSFTRRLHGRTFRMSASVVRLLPIDDLEYSCKNPRLVWP